jgi:hypothetical protein
VRIKDPAIKYVTVTRNWRTDSLFTRWALKIPMPITPRIDNTHGPELMRPAYP